MTATRLQLVEGFFAQQGPKAIPAGRFICIVARPPFLASGTRLRDLLPWSLLGTAIWGRRSRWSDTASTKPSARPPTR